jgi:hypothetical protein
MATKITNLMRVERSVPQNNIWHQSPSVLPERFSSTSSPQSMPIVSPQLASTSHSSIPQPKAYPQH